MEGARFDGSNAQDDGYKKFFPPAWTVSTRFSRDRSGDITTSDVGGMCSGRIYCREHHALLMKHL